MKKDDIRLAKGKLKDWITTMTNILYLSFLRKAVCVSKGSRKKVLFLVAWPLRSGRGGG